MNLKTLNNIYPILARNRCYGVRGPKCLFCTFELKTQNNEFNGLVKYDQSWTTK